MKNDQKNYESRMLADVYGPPPIEEEQIEMEPYVYGPPPIDKKGKKRLIFIIAGLVGLVIAFFGVRKMMSTVYGPQPCVYGPAPIDYEEELSPIDSDLVSSLMDCEGNEYE